MCPMEKEPISKKEQAIDGILFSLSGGAIGILAAISEVDLLSSKNATLQSEISAGLLTVFGLSLVLIGIAQFSENRKAFKK
jgi:predicted phage tail protein